VAGQTLKFADFEVALDGPELRRAGCSVAIQRKPLELLVYLLQRRTRVVSKAELLEHLWPDLAVTDLTLMSALHDLRRVLDDTDNPHRWIVSTGARDYRFVGAVEEGVAAPPASTERLPRSSELPFVERADVMEQLMQSLTAAAAGSRRVSFLAGEAGIGKSRTALEHAEAARQQGFLVCTARCHGGEGVAPFWPWLQIVRSALTTRDLQALAPRDRELIKPLAWIAPELAEPLGTDARHDVHLVDSRFRLFEALMVLLRELSRVQPLLVLIDDLHWGDEASLLFMEFLSEHLVQARLHIVAGFRATEAQTNPVLARMLGAVAAHVNTERLDLQGLGRASVAQLLAAASQRPPAQSFVESVYSATHGNAFFVCEIARLVATGQLDVTQQHATVPIPQRVRDAVRPRITRLSEGCRALLKLACVVGGELELLPLSSAAAQAQARTLALLDEAEVAGLLRSDERRVGRYRFAHDLVRETLYRDMTALERAGLHERMALALEALADNDHLEDVAYHYGEAVLVGAADKAVHYAQRAGDRAVKLMAYEAAVAHYKRAQSALEMVRPAQPERSCELLLAQAEASWGTVTDAKAVQEQFVRAAQSARAIGSSNLFARAALGRTGNSAGPGDFRDMGRVDELDIELLTAANVALGDKPSTLKASIMARLALGVVRKHSQLAEVLSGAAVRMAERFDDPETLASVLRCRHEVLSGPQYLRERLAIARRILTLARQTDCRPLELDALLFASRAHLELGEHTMAEETGTEADTLAGQMRHPGARFRSSIRSVLLLTTQGNFDQALVDAKQFLRRDFARILTAQGTFKVQCFMIYTLRGEHERLLQDPVAAYAREQWPMIRYWLATASAAVGDMQTARTELDAAASDAFAGVPRDHTLLGSLLFLADLCFATRDVERARQLYVVAEPFRGLVAAPLMATLCFGAVDRGMGVLQHVIGDYALAQQHFERAVQIEGSADARPLLAQTLERYAHMLRDRDEPADRERVQHMARQLEQIRRDLGCVPRATEAVSEQPRLSVVGSRDS
jgi:DNA-binding winged helix-turn-helix (wHTH) protein/tetratricopeptide (TPR) repeat protein